MRLAERDERVVELGAGQRVVGPERRDVGAHHPGDDDGGDLRRGPVGARARGRDDGQRDGRRGRRRVRRVGRERRRRERRCRREDAAEQGETQATHGLRIRRVRQALERSCVMRTKPEHSSGPVTLAA